MYSLTCNKLVYTREEHIWWNPKDTPTYLLYCFYLYPIPYKLTRNLLMVSYFCVIKGKCKVETIILNVFKRIRSNPNLQVITTAMLLLYVSTILILPIRNYCVLLHYVILYIFGMHLFYVTQYYVIRNLKHKKVIFLNITPFLSNIKYCVST